MTKFVFIELERAKTGFKNNTKYTRRNECYRIIDCLHVYLFSTYFKNLKIGTLRVHESTNNNKSLPHPTQWSIDNFKKWMAAKH